MTYVQNGLVQSSDFNTLAGGNPTATANTLNTTWATGSGSAGYGQSAVANITAGGSITVTPWNSLTTSIANAASHQGTSITTTSSVSAGNLVAHRAAVTTNLQSIYTGRLNAATQGTTDANAATFGSSWTSSLVFVHTVAFSSGDSARYFFNSGGQIKITASHPTGTGIDLLFSDLASNIGNVCISSPGVGQSSVIVGTTFNGVTRVGGGGSTPVIDTTKGYYGLTASNATVFTQQASTGPVEYLASNINIIAKTNGTQGANGDTGSVITIYTTWTESPTGLSVLPGSTTTATLVYPETVNLSNTWGSAVLSGSVSGS